MSQDPTAKPGKSPQEAKKGGAKSADAVPESKYRATLNMPDTPFPMRGDLPKREPVWVAEWEQNGLYDTLRAARQGAHGVVRPVDDHRTRCTWSRHRRRANAGL